MENIETSLSSEKILHFCLLDKFSQKSYYVARQIEEEKFIQMLQNSRGDDGARPLELNIYGLPGSGKSALVWNFFKSKKTAFMKYEHIVWLDASDITLFEWQLEKLACFLKLEDNDIVSKISAVKNYFEYKQRSAWIIDNVKEYSQIQPYLPISNVDLIIISRSRQYLLLRNKTYFFLPVMELTEKEGHALISHFFPKANHKEKKEMMTQLGRLPEVLQQGLDYCRVNDLNIKKFTCRFERTSIDLIGKDSTEKCIYKETSKMIEEIREKDERVGDALFLIGFTGGTQVPIEFLVEVLLGSNSASTRGDWWKMISKVLEDYLLIKIDERQEMLTLNPFVHKVLQIYIQNKLDDNKIQQHLYDMLSVLVKKMSEFSFLDENPKKLICSGFEVFNILNLLIEIDGQNQALFTSMGQKFKELIPKDLKILNEKIKRCDLKKSISKKDRKAYLSLLVPFNNIFDEFLQKIEEILPLKELSFIQNFLPALKQFKNFFSTLINKKKSYIEVALLVSRIKKRPKKQTISEDVLSSISVYYKELRDFLPRQPISVFLEVNQKKNEPSSLPVANREDYEEVVTRKIFDDTALASRRSICLLEHNEANLIKCRVVPAMPDGNCGFTAIRRLLLLQNHVNLAQNMTRSLFITLVIQFHESAISGYSQLIQDILRGESIEQWQQKFEESSYYVEDVHLKLLSRHYGLVFYTYFISPEENITHFVPEINNDKINETQLPWDQCIPLHLAHIGITYPLEVLNHFDGIILYPTSAQIEKINALLEGQSEDRVFTNNNLSSDVVQNYQNVHKLIRRHTMLNIKTLEQIAKDAIQTDISQYSDDAKASKAVFKYIAEQGYTWSRVVDEHLYQVKTTKDREDGEKVIEYLIEMRELLDQALYEKAIAALFKNSNNYSCRPEDKKGGVREDLQGYKLEYYVFKITNTTAKRDILEVAIKAPGSRDLTSDIDTTVEVNFLPDWQKENINKAIQWPDMFKQVGFVPQYEEYALKSLLQALIVYHFNRLNISVIGLTSSLSRDSNVYSKDDSDTKSYLKLYTDEKKKKAWLLDEDILSLKGVNKKQRDKLARSDYQTAFADFKQRKQRHELAASFYSLREYYSDDIESWNSFANGFEGIELEPPNEHKLQEILIPAMERTNAWYVESQNWIGRVLTHNNTQTTIPSLSFFEEADELYKNTHGGYAFDPYIFILEPAAAVLDYCQLCGKTEEALSKIQQNDLRIYANHYLYTFSLIIVSRIEQRIYDLAGTATKTGLLMGAKKALHKCEKTIKAKTGELEDIQVILERTKDKKKTLIQPNDSASQAEHKLYNLELYELNEAIKTWQKKLDDEKEGITNANKDFSKQISSYEKLLDEYKHRLNQLQLARIKSNFYAHEAYINFSALYHTVHWQQIGGDLSIWRRHVNLCSILQQLGFRLLHAKHYQTDAKNMEGYAQALKWGEMLYRIAKYEQRVADSFYGAESWFDNKKIDTTALNKEPILARLKGKEIIFANSFPATNQARAFFNILNRGVILVKKVKKDEAVLPQDKPTRALEVALRLYLKGKGKIAMLPPSKGMLAQAFNSNDPDWLKGDGKIYQDFLRQISNLDIAMFITAMQQICYVTIKQKLEAKNQYPTSLNQNHVRLWGHLFARDSSSDPVIPNNTSSASASTSNVNNDEKEGNRTGPQ